MMIRIATIFASIALPFAFLSCEKHDWEETKALFEPHGDHGDSHGSHGKDDHGSHDGHADKSHHGKDAKDAHH